MFTKDKKPARPARKRPEKKPAEGRKRPEGEQPRRRPSQEHPAEERRRTPEEQLRRRPPQEHSTEERKRHPEEQLRRRPPQEHPTEERRRPPEEQPRRRPSQERPAEERRRPSEEQPRRRPPQEHPTEERRQEEQPHRRQERPAEESRRPAEPRSRRKPQEGKSGSGKKSSEKKKTGLLSGATRKFQIPGFGKKKEAPGPAGKTAAARTPGVRRTPPMTEQTQAIFRQQNQQAVDSSEDQVFDVSRMPRETPEDLQPQARKPAPRRSGASSAQAQGTSYHRSTPKPKKTLMDYFRKESTDRAYGDPDRQAAAARARQASREAKKAKLRKLAKKFDTPAIVYTDPKPFNRNRLLIQLTSVLAVACALVLGLSLFFKVKVITVSGAETYSTNVIKDASGIKEGDNLLTFGRARASGQITANLPYINSVRIGIKLPDTVNIDVEEAAVAYSIKSGDGDWWLITSEGRVVKQIPGSSAKAYTQILGVQVDKPVVGEFAAALEDAPEEIKEDGKKKDDKETKKDDQKEDKKEGNSLLAPPVTVSGTMRLKSVLRILTALEDNDIVGGAATVNVENIEEIELWYGQRYQVNLGTTEKLEYKVACMYDAILQMSDYQTGMLDVSFTRKADQVVYTPFV